MTRIDTLPLVQAVAAFPLRAFALALFQPTINNQQAVNLGPAASLQQSCRLCSLTCLVVRCSARKNYTGKRISAMYARTSPNIACWTTVRVPNCLTKHKQFLKNCYKIAQHCYRVTLCCKGASVARRDVSCTTENGSRQRQPAEEAAHA